MSLSSIRRGVKYAARCVTGLRGFARKKAAWPQDLSASRGCTLLAAFLETRFIITILVCLLVFGFFFLR